MSSGAGTRYKWIPALRAERSGAAEGEVACSVGCGEAWYCIWLCPPVQPGADATVSLHHLDTGAVPLLSAQLLVCSAVCPDGSCAVLGTYMPIQGAGRIFWELVLSCKSPACPQVQLLAMHYA